MSKGNYLNLILLCLVALLSFCCKAKESNRSEILLISNKVSELDVERSIHEASSSLYLIGINNGLELHDISVRKCGVQEKNRLQYLLTKKVKSAKLLSGDDYYLDVEFKRLSNNVLEVYYFFDTKNHTTKISSVSGSFTLKLVEDSVNVFHGDSVSKTSGGGSFE
jgi:hypothetical protein